MSNYQYDLLVVGGGPGGYVAAIRGSQLGLKVGLVEENKLGGVCLNVGCIPSKALIHQATVFSDISTLEFMGVKVETKDFDYSKVQGKSRKTADKLSRGIQHLMKKNKIDVINGRGKIAGFNKLEVNSEIITFKNIILATGSRPIEIPGFKYNETVIDSTGFLMSENLPKSVVILGGGVIGVEFAYVWNSFGVDVTIVEMLDRILPMEDRETSKLIKENYIKTGIKVLTGHKALSYKNNGGKTAVQLEDSDGKKVEIKTEKILVAVGRRPNSENLGLESIGISPERGFIPVGNYYQTKIPGVFAIGDVIKTPQLAHVASREGEIAVEHMAGHKTIKQIDPNTIPSAVYSEPQVASFGLNEDKAKEEKLDVKVSRFPFQAIGKAVATEHTFGQVKIIADKSTNEILGASIIGNNAVDLLHELLLAKSSELVAEDISDLIHAHPSLSEATMEAAKGLLGGAIHI